MGVFLGFYLFYVNFVLGPLSPVLDGNPINLRGMLGLVFVLYFSPIFSLVFCFIFRSHFLIHPCSLTNKFCRTSTSSSDCARLSYHRVLVPINKNLNLLKNETEPQGKQSIELLTRLEVSSSNSSYSFVLPPHSVFVFFPLGSKINLSSPNKILHILSRTR